MITIRPAGERGRTRLDWLDSRHTFSFGDYLDPDHMGFSVLRVINDDVVRPGGGFATHAHRDMEILTIVLDGGLAHRDSTGTSSVIRPGEVQRMSAGTGIKHSEYNASQEDPVHFLQIWVIPAVRGLEPAYEQKRFADDALCGRLALVASPDGRDGSITVHQDVAVHRGLLDPARPAVHRFAPGRRAWLHVARGRLTLGGRDLSAGDGAAVQDEERLTIAAAAGQASEPADLLLFDLP